MVRPASANASAIHGKMRREHDRYQSVQEVSIGSIDVGADQQISQLTLQDSVVVVPFKFGYTKLVLFVNVSYRIACSNGFPADLMPMKADMTGADMHFCPSRTLLRRNTYLCRFVAGSLRLPGGILTI